MMAKRKIRLLPERGDRAAMKRMISASESVMQDNPTALERGRGQVGGPDRE